jgi:hypothetical protein
MRYLSLAAALLLSACAPVLLREAPPPAGMLHPQVSRVVGEARLQPRHNRELEALVGPVLLEPGDWVETGPGGKVELLLPRAAVRLYGNARVQVPYAFEGRVAAAREVIVEGGEVLVWSLAGEPFTVKTEGLEVEAPVPALFLVGSRDGVHQAACYRGALEARNVRVRGQTVVRLRDGQQLTLDDAATLAFLQNVKLPDEWGRWERPGVATAGLVPPPRPAPPPPLESPPSAAPAGSPPAQ